MSEFCELASLVDADTKRKRVKINSRFKEKNLSK